MGPAAGHRAEISGWSPALAPEAINCTAPDTGNMEMLRAYGTPEQRARWLQPLLDGSMRSALAIAEPDAAASDVLVPRDTPGIEIGRNLPMSATRFSTG